MPVFSVAGPRTGFAGKSGLFWEAIRIIQEMRCATNGRFPEIACFENVAGILNCNAGRDYQTVISAFTETDVPMPESGKWANAGMVRGGSVDFAWVVKDAQHYNVPQRRRRLLAIADFTGQRAAEILFESKSLSGYFAARELARQGVAADAERGIDYAGVGINGSVAANLDANCVFAQEGAAAGTVAAFMAGQAKNARSIAYNEHVSPTLKGGASGLNQTPSVLCVATGQTDAIAAASDELAPTLTLNHEAPYICKEQLTQKAYGICSQKSNSMLSENPFSGVYEADLCKTLDTSCLMPTCNQGGLCIVEPKIARTLTARHDSSPCADRGQNVVAIHQNQLGELRGSDIAYTLGTNANATGRNAPLIAFAQNTRDEVRDLKDVAGCLAAQPGMKQQTYVAQPAEQGNAVAAAHTPANCLTPWDKQQSRINSPDGLAPTLVGADQGGGRNPAGLVMTEVHPVVTGTLCGSGAGTSRTAGNCNETDLAVVYALQGNMIGRKDENGPLGDGVNEDVSFTLTAVDTPAVVYGESSYGGYREGQMSVLKACGGALGGGSETLVAAVDCRNLYENNELSATLAAKETGGHSLNYINPVRTGYVIRRLTPTECERLMGFDDGYTALGHDGKQMSDSARYSMLGNSIVTNVLAYIMQNVAERLGGGES